MPNNQPHFLLIETSSPICSVAYAIGSEIVDIHEHTDGLKHAAKAPLFAQSLIESYGSPDAIAVSAGPGSYTGLRIGVSLAKGICYGLNKPLIAVDTLQAMTNGFLEQVSPPENAVLIPLLDARRMEVYYAVFDATGKRKTKSSSLIITESSFSETPYSEDELFFFGSGAKKTVEQLARNHIHAIPFESLSATYLLKEALARYQSEEFEDIAYFEPYYIKDFHFTPPKKNILEKLRDTKP